MNTVYTPTTSEVRYAYGDARCPDLKEDHGLGCPADADFDRWLAAHDREVAAKALEYAAAVLDQPYTLWWESAVGATVREGGYDDPSRGVELIDWLRARAARIREGEH